jgi:hypothetical protein
MTEAELEAAFWRSFEDFCVTVPDAVPFVDRLIAIAGAYAAGDGPELTKARRAVLRREGRT